MSRGFTNRLIKQQQQQQWPCAQNTVYETTSFVMFLSFATIVALGRIDYISLKWNSSCRRHDMYENEQLQFNEP